MPTIATLLEQKGTEVATVRPDETVLDAAHQMSERRIGSLVIVDGEGRLAGIFTERDVLMRIVAKEVSPSDARVGDYMTTDPVFAPPDMSLEECGALMTRRRIRHLPVVEGGKVVGLVSIGDLTRHELEMKEQTIQGLKDYLYGG